MHVHASLSGERRKLKEIRFRVSRFSLINDNTFPNLLRQKRFEKGLKQKELAQLLGVNKNKIYEWENGKGVPSEELLERIYEILD